LTIPSFSLAANLENKKTLRGKGPVIQKEFNITIFLSHLSTHKDL